VCVCVQEKASLSARVEDMMEQSVALFQKRDDLDELEGFQQQEMAKVKHMVRPRGGGWCVQVCSGVLGLHLGLMFSPLLSC